MPPVSTALREYMRVVREINVSKLLLLSIEKKLHAAGSPAHKMRLKQRRDAVEDRMRLLRQEGEDWLTRLRGEGRSD